MQVSSEVQALTALEAFELVAANRAMPGRTPPGTATSVKEVQLLYYLRPESERVTKHSHGDILAQKDRLQRAAQRLMQYATAEEARQMLALAPAAEAMVITVAPRLEENEAAVAALVEILDKYHSGAPM